MNQYLGRRGSIRSKDPLESLIRQALEERIAYSAPPAFGRQVLIARAREASRSEKPSLRRLLRQIRLPRRHTASVPWSYYEDQGAFYQDWHLTLAINNVSSPLFTLMQ